MINGIDHVAVAVEDLDGTLALLERVLGIHASHRETIEGYGVEVATLRLGATAIELVSGTTPDSPIAKFIEKRGPGIHHIALDVDDIDEAIAKVSQTAEMIDAEPRAGKDDSRVAFIHPKSTGRILFELVQNRR
jgi:methylmalonyl-CoA/ethylmalonyl-CoA epimerase